MWRIMCGGCWKGSVGAAGHRLYKTDAQMEVNIYGTALSLPQIFLSVQADYWWREREPAAIRM